MFLPESFKEDDPARLGAFLRAYPFAALITHGEAGITVSHLPFVYRTPAQGGRAERGLLLAHMARPNSHWGEFDGQREALAIFQGPHGYVSPAWYKDHPSVPTWNYTAVHVTGAPRLVEEGEAWAGLEALVAAAESRRAEPWRLELPADYREKMMEGIVAFEMPIERWEGKFKLSQNRPPGDRSRVVAALRHSEGSQERELGDFMAGYFGLDDPR